MSLKLSRYCADTARDTSWKRKLLDVLLISDFPTRISYLKLVLLAPEIGSLFLPKIVRFDDVGGVHGVTEVVLENLQDGLDSTPAGVAPHVYYHAVPEISYILAEILRILNLNFGLTCHCFVFILGSFKSLPTSLISSLIQLNVQYLYLIPEETNGSKKLSNVWHWISRKIHSPQSKG